MKEFEKKYFGDPNGSGLLNADDAPFSLGINEWVNAENIRTETTDAGQINTVESIGSNVLKSVPLPSVTFLQIGSAEDTARNRFFIFKYNTTGTNHKITYFNISTNTEYDVLLSSQVTGGLNFSKDYPIHSARIIGNLLYWTDNYNEPRRINVDAAIKLNNPSYVTDEDAYTSPLSQSVINIVRRPPGRQPDLAFSTDAGKENFLQLFAGVFAIGYVYRDGEESKIGVPSDFVNNRYDFATLDTVQTQNTETTNVITVSIDNPVVEGELIDQDVEIVQFLVKRNNDNNYYVIREWNKNNPTDAAAIAAYNAGGTLSVDFYNDFLGTPVGVARSVLPFDSVPLLSETLETGLSRLFLGNNLLGYDTPVVTSLQGTANTSTISGVINDILLSYSSYQIGIVFRDYYKRKSGVVTNDQLVIQIPDRGDLNDHTFVEDIDFTLSNTNALNEIPDWAYYADIVITKNLRTRNFYDFWVDSALRYANKSVDGTFSYQATYVSGVYGIALNLRSAIELGQGITFEPGDKVRIYLNGLSSPPFTLNVIDQDGFYLIASPIDLGDLTTSYLTLAHKWTPYIQSGQEPFYTTGQSFRINNPGTDSRSYSVLSGSIPGDVFALEAIGYDTPSGVIQSMSPNKNNWNSYYEFFGEENFVTSLGQIRKETSIKWSNTLVEGTQINGLSSFEPLSEKLLPNDMGALKKLQQTSKVEAQGNVMLAIGEDETASVYLGEVQTYGADQRVSNVLAVDNVIGTVNVLRGNFGTSNPESATEYRGSVFWLDVNNGRFVQYASNGLFPISDYKMTRFWKRWCQKFLSMTSTEIENLGGRPFVFTTVDPRHDELLISLPKLSNEPPSGYLPDYPSTIYPFDIYDLQGKTLVYKIQLGAGVPRWKGAYTFYTEGFTTMQNELFSYKNGLLWQHNQITSTNSFYGVQYTSKIMCVSNNFPNLPKVYNNFSVEGNMKPSFVYFYNNYPYQQSSDLVDFDFKDLEGVWYATIFRNKLVPTATGFTTDGLLSGEKMRNVAMFCMIEFSPTTNFLELKCINFGFNKSLGHTV